MYLHVNWREPFNLTDDNVKEIPKDYEGVYVIWPIKNSIAFVGSGKIYNCLIDHINNKDDLVAKAGISNLKATYATIKGFENYKGAEYYLDYVYEPKIIYEYPDIIPREINISTHRDIVKPAREKLLYIPSGSSAKDSDCWDKYTICFRNWMKEKLNRIPGKYCEPKQKL